MTAQTKQSSILLGFDFGTKRIGVAIGQLVTKMARPLLTLHAKEGEPHWDKVTHLIKQWKPDAFVVGIPLNMDGTEQRLTHLARAFAQSLKIRYELPVYEVDERLTTVDAREQLFREGGYQALQDGQVDSMAAQLILQTWLDGERRYYSFFLTGPKNRTTNDHYHQHIHHHPHLSRSQKYPRINNPYLPNKLQPKHLRSHHSRRQ